MSLRTKLLVFSIILALIPLGIAGTNMIRITQDELESSAKDELISAAREISQDIDDFYKICLVPIQLIKKAVESEDIKIKQLLLSLLKEGVKNSPELVALQISVEGVNDPLIVTRNEFSDRLKRVSVDPVQILKLTHNRINMLRKKNDIFAGDLTYLANLDAWLLTVILPLDDKIFGVPATLSARINLDSLRERIKSHFFTRKGYITLIDAEGYKVFDKNTPEENQYMLVKTVKQLLASKMRKYSVAELFERPSGERMLGAYAFPSELDMGVIVEQNEAEAFMAVTEMKWKLLLSIIVGFVIALIGAAVMSVSLTRPLLRLTRAARSISEGNLSTRIEGKEKKDEIGELSKAFNKMVNDLRQYIAQLTETTKAKERAEGELRLAKNIQQSFLPKNFPKSGAVDVWGKCDPAREVGGDYFDFFQIDEDNYGMVIGDVSGKGVPAALVMAVSRTLFRILSSQEYSPDYVLTEFNNRLVALDQGANMFITLFYGVFNTKNGRLLYSTAGHNMPYIRTSETGGKFQILPRMQTMVAGMMDGIPMQLAETHLKKDDIIVLYTDGMIEALNEYDEEFGEEKLGELLVQYSDLSAKEMCILLIEDVQNFQKGRPQFDDMTMFILKVKT